MPGAPIFDEWSTPDVQDWLNTPLIIVAVIAILGVLWGVVLFIWKLARWTSKVDTGEQDFRAFTKEIRDDMRTIRDHIVQILARIPPAPTPVSIASPLHLNEFGDKIAASLKAQEWAAQAAQMVVTEVAGMQPFEIDDFSVKYVNERLDAQLRQRVAQCAYEFGTDRDSVQLVLRVVLRDELLKRVGHPDRVEHS